MAITNSGLVDLYDPAFREIFRQPFKTWRPIYPKLFNMDTSDRKFEKSAVMTNLGKLIEKASGAAFTLEDMLEGYAITQTHKTYALGVQIAQEALEDDLFDQLKKAPKILGASVPHTMEDTAAAIFRNAFDSAVTYGDGQQLIDTDHPRLDGADMSNRPATHADLAESTLAAGLQNLRESLDHKGLPQFLEPQYLLVAPAFEKVAFEIVKSEKRAGTSNNDANYIRGNYGLENIVNPYLQAGAGGDDDAWFITCKTHGLKGWIRKAPGTQTVIAESSGDMIFRVRARWLFTVDHPFGIYGSSGA